MPKTMTMKLRSLTPKTNFAKLFLLFIWEAFSRHVLESRAFAPSHLLLCSRTSHSWRAHPVKEKLDRRVPR